MRRRRFRQREVAAHAGHHGLLHVSTPGHGREEVGLVHHQDVVVPMQDVDLKGNRRLGTQVTVEIHRLPPGVCRACRQGRPVPEHDLASVHAGLKRLESACVHPRANPFGDEVESSHPGSVHGHGQSGGPDPVAHRKRRDPPATTVAGATGGRGSGVYRFDETSLPTTDPATETIVVP